MERALYGVYSLVVLYQKPHLFASLTCSISDTPQLREEDENREEGEMAQKSLKEEEIGGKSREVEEDVK